MATKRLNKSEALKSTEPLPDLASIFDSAVEETASNSNPNATSFLQSPFKTPRKDAKGVSAHVNFFTAPYYIRIAQELLGKVADFKTVSDVYVCALHYGLLWIQEHEEIGETSVQAQLNVWMGICQQAEMDEDIELAMIKMRETVNRKVSAGASQEAKRTVALARSAAEKMPDGYYKVKALEFLDKEFGGLWSGSVADTESKNGNGLSHTMIPLEAK